MTQLLVTMEIIELLVVEEMTLDGGDGQADIDFSGDKSEYTITGDATMATP